jgi:hypothetical protein
MSVSEEPSFAIEPEFALFILGGVMTLVVLGFVGFLIRSIIREERKAKRNE